MLRKEPAQGWNAEREELLLDAILKHGAHTPKYGMVNAGYEAAAKDLNFSGSFDDFEMNAARAHQKFERMIKNFEAHFEAQGNNTSGNEWTPVEELLQKLRREMKKHKDGKEREKKLRSEKEVRLKNAEIGLNLQNSSSSEEKEPRKKRARGEMQKFSSPPSTNAGFSRMTEEREARQDNR